MRGAAMRPFCCAVLVGTLVLPVADAQPLASPATNKTAKRMTGSPLTPQERALHALNRLTFGPRPGDLQQVEAMGVDRWIELQLHPEKIDDGALQTMLKDLPAMQLSEAKFIQKFPPNPMLREMVKNNVALPRDPMEQAIYANQIAYIKATDKAQKQAAGAQASTATKSGTAAMQPAMQTMQTQTAAAPPAKDDDMTPAELSALQAYKVRLMAMPPAQRFNALLQMTPGEPRKMMQKMKQPERLAFVEGFTPEQKEVTVALVDTNRVVAGEAMEQKLITDIYSERQLQEVMTDFWLNHFNVYDRKSGIAPWQIANYEREVIRPHAFGKFEDLLRAVATSPAMMVYLDNAESIGPDSKAGQRPAGKPGAPPNKQAQRGLNENYARELMELHTLGVNGGYTQHDVTEVAKVFTGWGVNPPKDGGDFNYFDRRHEPGDKRVLGKAIRDNGQQEGFEVLHMLATSPATAHFISRKLAIRFVSDTPPPSLVDTMAKSYLSHHGDIREVLRTMFRSPEFWSRESYRAKVKTPLEYVVSSVRATDAEAIHPQGLIASLNQMGMPLYGMQPPTGYPATADAWVSSSALLMRMNFALALTANKLPGIHCDLPALTGETDATASATAASDVTDEAKLEQVLLHGVVAPKTHDTVLNEMQKLPEQEQAATAFADKAKADAQADPLGGGMLMKKNKPAAKAVNLNVAVIGATETSVAAGLLLGSPDFQRR
jgi:uncharacterized protein (DUF1800 family)